MRDSARRDRGRGGGGRREARVRHIDGVVGPDNVGNATLVVQSTVLRGIVMPRGLLRGGGIALAEALEACRLQQRVPLLSAPVVCLAGRDASLTLSTRSGQVSVTWYSVKKSGHSTGLLQARE